MLTPEDAAQDAANVHVPSHRVLSSSADGLFLQNKVPNAPEIEHNVFSPLKRCDVLPSVVVRRSFGEQYASEASRGAELPQESSVGVLGVHSGHHHPGDRRFQ